MKSQQNPNAKIPAAAIRSSALNHCRRPIAAFRTRLTAALGLAVLLGAAAGFGSPELRAATVSGEFEGSNVVDVVVEVSPNTDREVTASAAVSCAGAAVLVLKPQKVGKDSACYLLTCDIAADAPSGAGFSVRVPSPASLRLAERGLLVLARDTVLPLETPKVCIRSDPKTQK